VLRYLLYRTFKDLFLCEKISPPTGLPPWRTSAKRKRCKGGGPEKLFWGTGVFDGWNQNLKGQEVFWVPLREPALHVFFIWPVGGDVKMGEGEYHTDGSQNFQRSQNVPIFTNYSAFILHLFCKK